MNMLLNGKHGQQKHRQHEQERRRYVILIHDLESKINEGAEIGGVQGRYTKHEGKCRDNPYHNVLAIGEISEKDFFLDLLPELRQCEEGEEGGYNHGDVELCVEAERQQGKIKSEHALDEQPGQAKVLDTEEHPNDVDREEGKDNTRHHADFLHHLAKEEFVGTYEETVKSTPNDEIP